MGQNTAIISWNCIAFKIPFHRQSGENTDNLKKKLASIFVQGLYR